MYRIAAGLMALAALCHPLHVTAQEEQADTALNRWSAEAGLTLQASGGNQSLTAFTATAALGHLRPDVFEANLNGRFNYGETDGQRVAENLRGELTVDLWPQAAWSPFLFATAEEDPIKKLEARLNAGAGAKRTFWQEGWNEVSSSVSLLYSYENLAVADSLGTGVTETARWSLRITGRKELGAGSRLEQIVLFQPAWDHIDDYQLESVTKFRLALSEQLSLATEVLYQRDNTPAPEVGPDDYSISVGLSLATEW